MPYYRHTKDQLPSEGESFATMQEARDGIDPKTQIVTFVANLAERRQWIAREAARFESGEYIPVPWATRWSRRDRWDKYTASVKDHFAHLSLSHVGLIAYTKSEEHGVQDRQTRVKPGKYLQEFYGDQFEAETIAEYVAQCKAENVDLKIARDADTIAKIYMNGPDSCMGGPEARDKGRPFSAIETHPTRVYGDSDLGVAYLGDPDTRVTARCVVWPDRKRRTRDYGDPTLRAMLERDGYELGSIAGARIRAILWRDAAYLMPYIDHCDSLPGEAKSMHASRDGDHHWLLFDRNGGIECSDTKGWISTREIENDPDADPDDYDDPEPETRDCDRCGHSYEYENEGTSEYCSRCEDERNVCERCDTDTWEPVDVGGSTWCESCAEDNTRQCAHHYVLPRTEGNDRGAGSVVECDTTWIDENEFTRGERRERERLGVDDLCRAHAEGIQRCADCSLLFADTESQCPHCAHTVRCDRTCDLNFDAPPVFPRYFGHVSGRFSDATAYIRVDSADAVAIGVRRNGIAFHTNRSLTECLRSVASRSWIEITADEAQRRVTELPTIVIDADDLEEDETPIVTSAEVESPF